MDRQPEEQLGVTYERNRDYPCDQELGGKGSWRAPSPADEIRSLNRRLKERENSAAQMRADGREKSQKIKVSGPSSPLLCNHGLIKPPSSLKL